MKVEYTLTVKAVCPVDGTEDVYECVVRGWRTIRVEDILKVVAEVTAEGPMFQEDLTTKLHDRLGTEVETLGSHSNVRTRCVVV